MLYYANWVLTNAQLELISSDISVIDYNFDDKKSKKKGEYDNTPAYIDEIQNANKKWLEKYGSDDKAGTGLSISQILSPDMKNEVGVRLND